MSKRRLPSVSAVAVLLPLLLLPLGTGLMGTVNAASSPTSTGAFFDHVVVILMENNGYCDVITTCGGHGPYETSLASTYSIAGACSSDSFCSVGGYTAVSHPSEPNYCALVSGAIYSDCGKDSICCFQDANLNIVDRFAAAGITWQAYAEDAKGSGTCAFSAPDNDHFPYLYFSDNDVASRCANFLTASTHKGVDAAFLAALNQKSGWANFIWLTPNNKDNGHNTGAAHGDEWLSDTVPQVLGSYMFAHSRSALFVVYDEGNSVFPHDYIYASWSGPVVKQGYVGTGSYNHYSLLATLEANWGFAPLTSNDGTATAMSEFFQ